MKHKLSRSVPQEAGVRQTVVFPNQREDYFSREPTRRQIINQVCNKEQNKDDYGKHDFKQIYFPCTLSQEVTGESIRERKHGCSLVVQWIKDPVLSLLQLWLLLWCGCNPQPGNFHKKKRKQTGKRNITTFKKQRLLHQMEADDNRTAAQQSLRAASAEQGRRGGVQDKGKREQVSTT